MSKLSSEFPLTNAIEGHLVKVNNNNKTNLLDYISKECCTKELAEKYKDHLEWQLSEMIAMRDHCCEVFSAAMGMRIINMKVDLANHYNKEYCAETHSWEYSHFIVHFLEVRDDPSDPNSVIYQTFEYKFSPRTRRGKILRHCYWILRLIAEIFEAKDHIVQLYDDEQEWEKNIAFGDD